MAQPPRVVDEWREWEAARRVARKGTRLRDASKEEKDRAWRELMLHLKAALKKEPPDELPEQRKLFE
jgi:hypothetical protein